MAAPLPGSSALLDHPYLSGWTAGAAVLFAEAEAGEAGGSWDGWFVVLLVALVLVVLTAAVLAVVCWRWPMLCVRAVLWLATHTIYRVRVHGAEHVPKTGPALLVCNHITYIDWLLLLATQRRFI